MGTGRLIDIKSSKLVNARTRHLLKGNVKVTLIKHVYPKSRKKKYTRHKKCCFLFKVSALKIVKKNLTRPEDKNCWFGTILYHFCLKWQTSNWMMIYTSNDRNYITTANRFQKSRWDFLSFDYFLIFSSQDNKIKTWLLIELNSNRFLTTYFPVKSSRVTLQNNKCS